MSTKVFGAHSLVLLASLFLSALIPIVSGRAHSAESAPANASTEQTYKNIQVLKGIPANRLIPAMQFITASLGVECGFCHVENHFDQDDKKPKQIARKMMQMMASINQNNFEGHREVTCNTCHRGARVPVGIPAITESASMIRIAVVEDEKLPPDLPTADQLLDKYIAALGGEKAIEKVSSRIAKGTANFAGRDVPVEVYDKAPDQRVSIMRLPNGDSLTGFDGEHGWVTTPGRATREMPVSDIEGAKIDADLQLPLHLKRMFPDLRQAKPEKINGHDSYQLLEEEGGQPRLRLYFDQQTDLLTRMVRYSDSPLGLNPVRVDYSDYRAVDGVPVPYRWTVARPSGQFTIQATEITQNVAIDDAKFARPAEPQHVEPKP
jgi:photosynthetic reaction center cytochrome c subunit